MKRRAALIALLGGVVAVVLIIVLSDVGSDEQPGDAASVPSEEQRGGRTGSADGTADGSTSAGGRAGTTEQRARERARRRARRRSSDGRGPRRQEQGRLGPQAGGSPAQGGRPFRGRPGAAVATIELVGGAPVGGVQRIRFPKDERARLFVRSNTEEVIVISGYGLSRRVRAGGTARFYFDTSKEGLFSIDLDRGQTRIGVLAVG